MFSLLSGENPSLLQKYETICCVKVYIGMGGFDNFEQNSQGNGVLQLNETQSTSECLAERLEKAIRAALDFNNYSKVM